MTQKLYCYVDETGQDTRGKFFIAVVAIMESDRDNLRRMLSHIEQSSGKGIKKWTKSTKKQRAAYVEQVLTMKGMQGKIFFSKFSNTTKYLDCTLHTIAWAITSVARVPYQATVLIDGLQREEQHKVGTGLRNRDISIKKVKGVRDESDEFIRLADAIAGFMRDHQENSTYLFELYNRARKRNVLAEEPKKTPVVRGHSLDL